MQRRKFITLLIGGLAIAFPHAVSAQQSARMRRIGVLMGYPQGDRQAQANVVALREGLQHLGWVENQNIQLEYRWAGDDPEKARSYGRELIATAPDLIIPSTNQVTEILREETQTIPIVFVFVGDPIGSGFVASLSRPGGNLTGFANFENSIGGKWLELLKEIAPSVTRVGFIYSPDAPPNVGFYEAAKAAAPALNVELIALPVHNRAEIESGVTAFATKPDSGLIIAPHAVTLGNRELLATLAARYRLPAIYSDRYFADSGGLIAFGNNTADLFQRAASYVDLILKGAKPAELPVQLPTKFELVINLKTAQTLGLKVPWFLQQRADEVIE